MATPRLPGAPGCGWFEASRAVVRAARAGVLLLATSLAVVAWPAVAVAVAETGAAPEADSGLVRRLGPRAEAGDAASQFLLGSLYFQGSGVERDLEAAVRWYRAAAEQGHPLAQHNLGNAYMNGDGVAVDDREAMRWWRLAGEQDVAAAQFNLGLHLYYGRVAPPDEPAARRWIERAADNGHEVSTLR